MLSAGWRGAGGALLETAVDDHRAVLRGVHAVQHGPREHEHRNSADEHSVWVGYPDHWSRAVLLLLVRPHDALSALHSQRVQLVATMKLPSTDSLAAHVLRTPVGMHQARPSPPISVIWLEPTV